MTTALDTSLLEKTQPLSENPDELERLLKHLSQSADDNAIDRVITLYSKTIVALEQEIWKQKPTAGNIGHYHEAFKVLEQLHELKTDDTRYCFKIVIPVADRPQHLKSCLDSLLELCQAYGYGGYKDNKFNKISVLIADDSKDANNITQHKNYCTELTNNGIDTEYFGLQEQLTLVDNTNRDNDSLKRIISDSKEINEPLKFSHKGASIMRNITYLKLNQTLSQGNHNKDTLIYFIDSDQEFSINTIHSDDKHYAINYFHYLNEIFKKQDVSILTGKVVGDPPVSPSVMAGNFQQDIKNFLHAIETAEPDATCRFHQDETDRKDDAAYHDMANLFGFSNHGQAFDYHCTLKGNHTNADCFCDFSEKLGHFFYGEHPTRKTFFHYEKGFTATTPARTVYTGNYVIKPENLDHFIPFSTLKLRMAGPVLGRILNARLKDKFVSANLPMLHNRTVNSTGQSEFRAGVKNNDASTDIDLSNEFIRQFYGDVMLFSIKKITEQDGPFNTTDSHNIQSILNSTYEAIRKNYIEKHGMILQLRTQIDTDLNKKTAWWNSKPDNETNISQAIENFNTFLDNILSNFAENSYAYQQISSPETAKQYLDPMLSSILHYPDDIKNWKKYLAS
ncbi:MAG: hypothetical protein KAT12_00365 [Gammaproteobacteria bacterium]|nr:hypothetical protein [Gammaproteobacteria bacterium]